MRYEQFLLLRVLWKEEPSGQFRTLPKQLSQHLAKAEKMLAAYQSWSVYCNSFGRPKIPEGSFAVACHYQMQAASNRGTIRPNIFDTPIAKRTRAQLILEPPETPSKKPTKLFPTPIVDEPDPPEAPKDSLMVN